MHSNRRADVFISYSTEDNLVAMNLCNLMEERGICCWIAPRDVLPGSHFAEEVLAAIEHTQATIVLLSDHSNRSTHVRNEIERAVSKSKPVLTIRIRNVLPSRSLELYLSAFQWVDAWTPSLVQTAEQIFAALNALIPSRIACSRSCNASIGVIALGGGAIRSAESLANTSPDTLRLIAAHTYEPTLERSKFPIKIHLGKRSLAGSNAGGDPMIGRAAAQEAESELLQALAGLDLLFVIACLGGGTGTGAAPFVCSRSRDMGILTVGVATTPFQLEGTRRGKVAAQGFSDLSKCADSLVLIPNQGLLQRGIHPKQAFINSDLAVVSSVRSVSDLILIPGIVNVDFADVLQVFHGTGIGRIGIGRGSGENAAVVAAKAATSSPLLNGAELRKARSIIINITAGPSMSLLSVDEAARIVQKETNDEAIVVSGNIVDETINDDTFLVTLIAMGAHVI